jgi:hypothetical protein
MALLLPASSVGVSACASVRSTQRDNGVEPETTSVLDRYSEVPDADVIQGIAETPSRAWTMVYASLPVPGSHHVW